MADQKNSNLTNDLFDAIYTIVTGVVAKQNYDITKECKIIEVYLDDKGARTGVYKVKSQDAVFDAYAKQGEVYSAGQQVYVQIPNGDFNAQKFIIGLKINTEDEQSIYNLKLPFDDFVGLYNLSYNTPMEEVGYWANCPYHGEEKTLIMDIEKDQFPLSEDHVWHWENREKRPIYATKLGLEVDVTTLLHTFRPQSGEYGLRICVRGLGTEDITSGSIETITQEYYFTNDNMYGNPYAYTLASTQQIVVDISKFTKSIDSIDIWFWQDHKFIDEYGNAIPWGSTDIAALKTEFMAQIKEIEENRELSDSEKEIRINELYVRFGEATGRSAELKNIVFNNLHCLLGLSVEEMQEETITLYTYDVATYGADPENEAVRRPDRKLYAAWVHKVDNTIELIDTYERLKELEAQTYWYRYDPEWAPEHPEYDSEIASHRFGGNYWRPIGTDKDVEYDENTPINFDVTPDINKAKERYKVVIHHDNTYTTSNVFIFQNYNTTIESDIANLARNDKVILRCAVLKPSGYDVYDSRGNVVGYCSEKLPTGKGYFFTTSEGKIELLTDTHRLEPRDSETLVPDDTVGNFFVYNENNNVLANDDNVLFSDVQYYIEPWIKVEEDRRNISSDYVYADKDAAYVRLSEYTDRDGNKPNFNITWQFPESFTMIRAWGMLDDSARDIAYWNHRSDFLFELDKKATRYFYIDATHNVRYNDNEISATIDIDGMGSFSIKKELIFGRAGAFGCEYTPVITISEPAGNYYVDTRGEFEIYCLVYDRKGQLLPLDERAKCKFTWKYYGTAYKPKDDRDHLNYKDFIGNVIRGRITQPYPFVVEVTVSGAAEYDITVRKGIMVCNDASFMQTHDVVCPDRVEFRSDGQAPIYTSNVFEVQKIIVGEGTSEETGETYDYMNELIYPTWQINQTKVLRLIEKESEYPTFTLPNGNTVSKEKQTSYALGFSAQQLNTHVAEPSAYAQQWTEDLLTDEYFTYIYFTQGTVTVAQGIAFAQNLYPSSLVNEWDGQSLSLDYENSAIIAKMIAAGTKDQRNRFTGVMMGDWHEKADESLDTPGLYGFNAGQQSFGFKTDGTGFIGPSGEGRIHFDGRNALISNSAQTCYINLNPRRLLDYLVEDKNEESGYVISNQAWDAIGNQSISQFFLYTQTPRRISTFCDELADKTLSWMQDWSHHEELLWVDEFMNDEDHDYFLVDPNYGVVTTGGIFARYGRIGKDYPWVISDYGLTQKNIFGRIFLGNPEKNLSNGSFIPNPTYTLNGQEVTSYTKEYKDGTTETLTVPENFFTASFANEDNVIQTGIRSDGYLYTKYATIGNWYINDYEIYATDRNFGGGPAQGYRKFYDDFIDANGMPCGFRDQGDGEHNGDWINLNGHDSFIAFMKGKMIIDGRHGWMGLSTEDEGIELIAEPTYYNMLINFTTGDIGFGLEKATGEDPFPIPKSFISGNNGSAYFSKGQVQIDGETASIYCGISTESEGVFTDLNEDISVTEELVEGNLYLAAIHLQGLTYKEDTNTNFIMPRAYEMGQEYERTTKFTNGSKDDNYAAEGTIIPFDLSGFPDFSQDDSDIVTPPDADGLVWLTNFTGTFHTSVELTDAQSNETLQLGGAGLFAVYHDTKGMGFNVYLGSGGESIGSNVTIVPRGADLGYLYNWNIYGESARFTKNLDVDGSIYGGTIFMLDDNNESGTPTPSLVATQAWVNRILCEEVYPKIVAANNLAAAAMNKAIEALKKAKNALAKAVGQANLRVDPAGSDGSAIISIELQSIYGKMLQESFNGNGNTPGATVGEGTALALAQHAHVLNYTIADGKLTASVQLGTTGADTAPSTDEGQPIFEDGAWTMTTSGGKLTGSLTVAGKQVDLTDQPEIFGEGGFTMNANGGSIVYSLTIAGATVSDSFNIAATKYHMDQIAAAYKAGYTAGFAQCSKDTKYTASTYTASSDYHSHSYTASSHSVNADGSCNYTPSSHSHSHSYTPSTYSASSFTPATEKTPGSGWEAYY